MAYFRSNMISRQGYSGMGGVVDTIAAIPGDILGFYGKEQQAVGAQQQANTDLQNALNAQQTSPTTIVLIAGVAVVALLLFRKKAKAATP
jgi:hypothetical protein